MYGAGRYGVEWVQTAIGGLAAKQLRAGSGSRSDGARRCAADRLQGWCFGADAGSAASGSKIPRVVTDF